MSQIHIANRTAHLSEQLRRLSPSIERAREAVRRLEHEPVPAGAAGARAARVSAAQTMLNTLAERQRRLTIALHAIAAEHRA